MEKRALQKDSLILGEVMVLVMEGLGEIDKVLTEGDFVKSVIRLG